MVSARTYACFSKLASFPLPFPPLPNASGSWDVKLLNSASLELRFQHRRCAVARVLQGLGGSGCTARVISAAGPVRLSGAWCAVLPSCAVRGPGCGPRPPSGWAFVILPGIKFSWCGRGLGCVAGRAPLSRGPSSSPPVGVLPPYPGVRLVLPEAVLIISNLQSF